MSSEPVTPTQEGVEERIRGILTTSFKVDAAELKPGVTFEELDLDSLDLVELAMSVEEQVGTGIPDDQLEHVHTVEDAAALVVARMGD